ncbi:hypothetical protein [Paracoccus fontiphilus]|uniref:Uncharacterized protein n=1 Tax=Paracoccus fontiphilus TaxID=1815556 RepID=A0ABV7IF48_9RHOB|nr:hypothetical protein [Paracoccus fontiphilus]
MTTIPLRLGGSEPLVIRPKQPDGTMPDLTGSTMQLRIGSGDACIIVPGVITDDGYDLDVNDLDLPTKLHTASIWIDWGQGWRWQGEVFLNIIGGC